MQRGLPLVLRANGTPLVHVFATGITLPRADLRLLGPGATDLEQRHLGLAIAALERRPQDRVIWVGSRPLPAAMVEIYGRALTDDRWSTVHPRLEQFHVGDPSPTRWLPEKILADGPLLGRLKQAINGDQAQLHVYRMTPAEAELAVALRAPAVALSPEHQILGTKSGSRALARQVITAKPQYAAQLVPGREHVRSTSEVAAAIVELLRAHDVSVVVVKANEGSSGEGQVGLALPEALRQALAPLSAAAARAFVNRWLKQGCPGAQLRFRHPRMTWQRLLSMVQTMGGVVEQFIPEVLEAQRSGLRVPEASVQFLADGLEGPRIIGTADVIRHGDAELFAGPSNHPERRRLQSFASELLRAMEDRLLGPGSVDFTGAQVPRFTEINARETAVTCRVRGVVNAVAGAFYDPPSGQFLDARGRPWHWVGADHLSLEGHAAGVTSDKPAGDQRLLATFARGSFRNDAIVLPTRIDGRGGYGLVAVAPDDRDNALEAFELARNRLQRRE